MTEKTIQSVLNKLISEEWMASIMYKQFIAAVNSTNDRHVIKDLMIETSDDEMDDHYLKLVKFAAHNDFKIPCQIKDYEKYASENTVKQFNGWKKDKNAKYYIEEAIKAEVEAIASYEEVINKEELPQELLSIVLGNYYDEIEHLQKFQTMLIAYNASMVLKI